MEQKTQGLEEARNETTGRFLCADLVCGPELLLPLCAVLNGFTGSTGLLHGASAAAATWEENPAQGPGGWQA